MMKDLLKFNLSLRKAGDILNQCEPKRNLYNNFNADAPNAKFN